MPAANNAVKHGAFSKITVMPWESQEEFDKLHYELVLELDPYGELEEAVVREIADLQWRKSRLLVGQVLAAHKDAAPAELVEAAKRGVRGIAEYLRSGTQTSGSLLMTGAQAIDFVKKKLSGSDLPQISHAAPAPSPIERAYDPEFMLKFLRAEAAIDARITKLLQRLAGLKAFKKLHGLDSDLQEVAEEAPPTEPELAPKLEWSIPAKR